MANTKIPSELIADSSITAAKLADGTITTADIADSNVTTAKIADSNVTTAKIGDAQVTTAKITDANVTTGKIADDAVTTAKMASNSVTSDTIASGITLAGNTTFSGNILKDSGDLTLDVPGAITLDAGTGGTGIVFADDGTSFGSLKGLPAAPTRLIVDSAATAGYLSVAGTEYFAWNTTDIRPAQSNMNLGVTGASWNDLFITGSIKTTSGDLTLDVAGNINLDADGANVYFNDGGTERYRFKLDATPEINVTGGTFTIKNNTSDADILFSGNDDGSSIIALTLDMSNAGAATFNGSITSGNGITMNAGNLTLNSTSDGNQAFRYYRADGTLVSQQYPYNNRLNFQTYNNQGLRLKSHGSGQIELEGNVVINEDSADLDFRVESDSNQHALFLRGSDGNIGIGTSNPQFNLDVTGLIRATSDVYLQGDVYVNSKIRHNGDVDNYISFSAADTQSYVTGNSTRLQITNSLVRFNQENNNQDFSVYSANSDNMLYVDASTDRVGIGTDTPLALLHINGSGDAVRVTSTNTGSGGAQVDLLQYTTSPADNDIHGMINFGGYTSGTSSAYGSSIRSVWSDVSAKEGQLQFFTRDDSDFAARMIIDKDGKVGIGTTSPSTKLTVKNDSNNTSFGENNIITLQNANTTDNSRMGLAFTGNTGVGSGLAVMDAVSYDQSHGKTSLNFSVYSGSWHNDMMVLKEGKVAIGSTSDALANMSGLFRVLDSTGGDRTVAHFGAHNYGDTGKTFINIGTEYGDGTSRIGSFNDTGNKSVLVFDTHSATSGQFTERMRITSNGVMHLNNTGPEMHSAQRGIVFENGSLINDITRGSSKAITLAQNATVDTGNTWAYLATDEASYYQQFGGNHYFGTAPSGTAGADVTFNTKMMVHNSGCIDLGANVNRSLGSNITTTVTSGSAGSGFWMSTGNSSATSTKLISYQNGSVGEFKINQGSGVNGGSILFSINDGEKMRINSNGSAEIGSANNAGSLKIINTSADVLVLDRRGSDGTVVLFRNDDTNVGGISVSGSTVAYNTSSDYRLKENVNYTWDATARLKQLKPAQFDWKLDGSSDEGFIAHEVSTVLPQVVTGQKDGTEMQAIDHSKLVPLLVKTIQELEARIATLEG